MPAVGVALGACRQSTHAQLSEGASSRERCRVCVCRGVQCHCGRSSGGCGGAEHKRVGRACAVSVLIVSCACVAMRWGGRPRSLTGQRAGPANDQLMCSHLDAHLLSATYRKMSGNQAVHWCNALQKLLQSVMGCRSSCRLGAFMTGREHLGRDCPRPPPHKGKCSSAQGGL